MKLRNAKIYLGVKIFFFVVNVPDNITAIAWHPSSRYLATAGGNDRQIRVWHNAVGIKVEIDDLEGRLIRAKSDTIRVKTALDLSNQYRTCAVIGLCN